MQHVLKSLAACSVLLLLLSACAAPSLNDEDRQLLNQAIEASEDVDKSVRAADESARQAGAAANRAESAADRAEAAAVRAEDAAADAKSSARKAEKAFEMSLTK